MSATLIDKLHAENMRKDPLPEFAVGDTVKVMVRIKEGEKERLQAFAGTVIARQGRGATETFTVRRISFGEGVERVFPVHSPSLASLEVQTRGRRKRAKLYYIRERSGKQARAAIR